MRKEKIHILLRKNKIKWKDGRKLLLIKKREIIIDNLIMINYIIGEMIQRTNVSAFICKGGNLIGALLVSGPINSSICSKIIKRCRLLTVPKVHTICQILFSLNSSQLLLDFEYHFLSLRCSLNCQLLREVETVAQFSSNFYHLSLQRRDTFIVQ